jgi:hypothetical protein
MTLWQRLERPAVQMAEVLAMLKRLMDALRRSKTFEAETQRLGMQEPKPGSHIHVALRDRRWLRWRVRILAHMLRCSCWPSHCARYQEYVLPRDQVHPKKTKGLNNVAAADAARYVEAAQLDALHGSGSIST